MVNGQPDQPGMDNRGGRRVMKEDTEHPTITIEWNQDAQGVAMKYDERIKTWDMRCALLEMALNAAKFDLNVARMQKMNEANMQAALQAQAAAQEANGINSRILKG
jgi:hypothetical protein